LEPLALGLGGGDRKGAFIHNNLWSN
jgi:hypothetical protein